MTFVLINILTLGSLAFGLCVSTERANLRSGPGPKKSITWVAPLYTPLLKLSRKGSWYRVQDQDGEKHWVFNKNVTSSFRCVSVITKTANLRRGPGSKSPLGDIRRVDKYTPFKRIDIADNGWYQVQAPWGGKYWISDKLVWRPVKVSRVTY